MSPNSTKFRATGWLILLAFVLASQAHLGLLQLGAWSSMLASRAPQMGLSGAIESTFSGEAPCPMCCKVEQERQLEAREPSKPGDPAPPLDDRTSDPLPLKALAEDSANSLPSPVYHLARVFALVITKPGISRRPPTPPPKARPA